MGLLSPRPTRRKNLWLRILAPNQRHNPSFRRQELVVRMLVEEQLPRSQLATVPVPPAVRVGNASPLLGAVQRAVRKDDADFRTWEAMHEVDPVHLD